MTPVLSAFFRAWWVRLYVRTRPAELMLPAAEHEESKSDVMPAAVVPAMETEIVDQTAATGAAEAVPTVISVKIDADLRARTLETLGKLQQIPALQSLAQGFLRATARTDGSVDEVVAAVEKDPALCVRVLRMANSALVRPEQRIEDVFTAVQMLGLRRVSTLAQALFTMRDARNMTGGLDWRHLWIHALATAAIADELQRQLGRAGGPQLYLAALLHDVGKIVLSTVAPEAYRAVLAEVWNNGSRLDDLEMTRFGVGHCEAGVIFGRQSGLPDEVIAAIAHHADPAKAETHRETVALVSLANYFSKSYGLGFSGSRLDDADGDLESLPGWAVLAEANGSAPDVGEVSEDMRKFVSGLKQE
ncbi:MAG TPA: HDOD domain-containing protein, partial [Lacunisphaera sp.]|nr:HDOD domain-containing protein [Lacunisphaera sp.]